MPDFEREAIAGYVEKIGREWRSGQATEHTYRPMLKELFEALLPRVLVINEPRHIECGAPDYLIRRGTDTLGFIEPKGDRIALADEANFIKRDCPVMVVMGNPPYSVSSANRGEWIQEKIADYKQGLNEKKLNLDDDYIKFLRLGQYYVDKNGEGVLAFISNNSFLDGITHRQMRKSLLESFDEIYILNLHGNARKKETASDGSKDENVFDIMQGVSINIFVKGRTRSVASADGKVSTGLTGFTGLSGRGGSENPVNPVNLVKRLATVRYAELYGVREDKYAFLDANTLESVKWQTLDLQEPYYFFVPKDFGLQEEYEKGFKIDELMPVNNLGVKTDRDQLFVDADRKSLADRIQILLSPSLDSNFAERYNVRDSSGYKLTQRIVGRSFDDAHLSRMLYRVFDPLWVYYDPDIISRPAYAIMRHMQQQGNLALLTLRNDRSGEARNYFVADCLVGKDAVSSLDNCRAFPLYLYNDAAMAGVASRADSGGRGATALPGLATDSESKVERRPNFDAAIYAKICAAVGEKILPEDVFNYIYGVLHTPSYREKYREFLKIDFPRIPYPKGAAEFRRIAAVGEKLVKVHLLKDEAATNPFANPYAKFEGTGNGVVEKVGFDNGRVYVNAGQYFDNVPESAWSARVGGYQPAQKWLKDRRGRVLASDDLVHYKAIVFALLETARLMAQL